MGAAYVDVFTVFQGHSWKEIGLASQELNQQRRVSARGLAEFLLSVWEREGAYAERVRHQRERDRELADRAG